MSTKPDQPSATRAISPANLHDQIRRGIAVELIDVRTPAEFRSVHASPARSVPIETLDPTKVMRERTLPNEPLYIICKSGERARKACEAFARAGFGDQVVNVTGGTLAWAASGLPVTKGRYVLPLDRQVQTTTGFLILLGCGLGAFINHWWFGLAAYCGLGMMFAGLSGICPLGYLMARMPWNQVELDSEGSCCG